MSYRALDPRLNRSVAIKVLPRDAMADAERSRRFVQEAKAASALNHPNIITSTTSMWRARGPRDESDQARRCDGKVR